MSNLIKFFLLTVVLVFASVVWASAQETPTTTIQPITTEAVEEVELDETVEASDLEVSEPTLLPDSPFYFLKNWQRRIKSFFTFNKIEKAELQLKYASEKLLEAKKLAERTEKAKLIKKATENYQEELDKIKETAEKIKEKASENPKVGEFLDKFIKHQVLHQKILEKLEEKVPEQALEKIKQARERHLQRFGEVMGKLEEKTKITEYLEKNLEELEGSKFKQFKNLEILKKLEEKVPQETKKAIRKARENILGKFKEKVEEMSTTTQEGLENYIEKIQGEVENKMEIIEDIKLELKEKPEIQKRLEGVKEKILEKIRKKEIEKFQSE
ncbi:MAG: DUF5667 domain-containing protein [Patescibacteria group bacterium]|nr:DUF5667 domain-containing protein [Patescibacteria group bacterium]